MLMYGYDRPDILNISFSGSGVVFAIASMKEGLTHLRNLVPPNYVGRFTNRDFDLAYADYVLSNDNVFCEFFQIIYNLYIGKDVLIVYTVEEDWAENIVESLLKLIQQRYGYNAIRIDSDEDYIYARNNFNTDFQTGYGLLNLDQDKERFTYLVESLRLSKKVVPYDLEGFVVPYGE